MCTERDFGSRQGREGKDFTTRMSSVTSMVHGSVHGEVSQINKWKVKKLSG